MKQTSPGVTIRVERPNDRDAISAIHRRAFGGDDEAGIVEAIRQSSSFDAALSLVADRADLAVGHILFSGVRIRDGQTDTSALALAPLAVVPEVQRQGIGSQLIRAGLHACHDRGHKLVLVLGHAEYYARFGFVEAFGFGIRAPWAVPVDAFRVVELVPGALVGVRGVVEYPACFHG